MTWWRLPTIRCCSAFRRAMQPGTGSGGKALVTCDEGACRLGESLPAMAFCPFCGEALPLPVRAP